MITIYKYNLEVTDNQQITTNGEYSEILSVGLDANGQLAVWVRVDTDSRTLKTFRIIIVGTGNSAEHIIAAKFLGTVTMSPFVWHVFVK